MFCPTVTPGPVVPNWGSFTIQETLNDIWGHFWLSQLNDLTAPSGDRTVDGAGHPSVHRTDAPQPSGLAPDVHHTEVEEPCSRLPLPGD